MAEKLWKVSVEKFTKFFEKNDLTHKLKLVMFNMNGFAATQFLVNNEVLRFTSTDFILGLYF